MALRSRRRTCAVYGSVLALACSLALLYACAPFSATDDSNGGADGGPVGADGAPVAPPGIDANGPSSDAGGDAPTPTSDAGTCFSMTAGYAPFTAKGNVDAGPSGTNLHMAPSSTTSLTHTFTSPKPITASTVDMLVQMKLSGTATWGPNYLDLLIQGYGMSPDYVSNPVSSLELGASGIEVNVWSAKGHYEPTNSGAFTPNFFSPAVSTAEIHFVVVTAWAATGFVDIALGGVGTAHRIAKTNTAGASSSLTLVIGGDSNSAIPTLDLLIKQVCVTLE